MNISEYSCGCSNEYPAKFTVRYSYSDGIDLQQEEIVLYANSKDIHKEVKAYIVNELRRSYYYFTIDSIVCDTE